MIYCNLKYFPSLPFLSLYSSNCYFVDQSIVMIFVSNKFEVEVVILLQ